jgi:hypothetical protein
MANVEPFEIVAGPLDVWFNATGSGFPALTDDPGTAGWTKVGYTEGGVKVGSPQVVVELRADQVTGILKAVRSEEDCVITFDIASLTLENWSLAMNRALSGGGSDGVPMPLYRGGFQVETLSLLLKNDHLSPYGDSPLQFELPVCFQAGSPEADFTKDNKAVLHCEFHVQIDPTVEPNDPASFGYIRAD